MRTESQQEYTIQIHSYKNRQDLENRASDTFVASVKFKADMPGAMYMLGYFYNKTRRVVKEDVLLLSNLYLHNDSFMIDVYEGIEAPEWTSPKVDVIEEKLPVETRGQVIRFTACEHLDYSDSYSAKKDGIMSDGQTKTVWNRPVVDASFPKLVQFCSLRGRLNDPESCLCDRRKMCSDYKDYEHEVELS